MAMNRRQILLGGVSAALVTLTGCPKTQKTIVSFVNSPASTDPIAVKASAAGKNFSSGNLAPGAKKSSTYLVKGKAGETKPITGTITVYTLGGPVDVPIPAGETVVLGKTNTWTVTTAAGMISNVTKVVS